MSGNTWRLDLSSLDFEREIVHDDLTDRTKTLIFTAHIAGIDRIEVTGPDWALQDRATRITPPVDSYPPRTVILVKNIPFTRLFDGGKECWYTPSIPHDNTPIYVSSAWIENYDYTVLFTPQEPRP